MYKKCILTFFYFICLISNLLFNSGLSLSKDSETLNQFTNLSSKSIEFSVDENYGNELFNLVKDSTNISVIKDNIYIGAYCGKALYFDNFFNNFPIIEGRFFNENDFKDTNNKIVIGKDLVNLILHIDDKKYIKFNGINYEVIGLMGYETNTSLLDKSFFINFNGYINQANNNKIESLVVTYSDTYDQNLIKKIANKFENATIGENFSYSSLFSFTYNNKDTLLLFIMIVVCLNINIIILSINYFKKKKIEIGIRKLYGANNFNIEIMLVLDYLIMAFISFILASLTNILIIKSKICIYDLGDKLYLLSFILTFIIICILGISISFINIKNSNRYDICTLIKGD